MRELEGTLSTNHSAFHRPSASNVQATQMAPKQSELQIGADEGGDAEAKKFKRSSAAPGGSEGVVREMQPIPNFGD